MLRLRPYVPGDADVIVTWADSEFVFKQWSGNRYDRFPIDGADMNAYYAANQDYWPLTAFDDDGLAGHLIVHYADEARTSVALGFVIVDDARRGQGIGRELVCMASRFAFEFLGARKVELKVFDNNPQAVRCYEAAGFRTVPLDHELAFDVLGERWGCLVMELLPA